MTGFNIRWAYSSGLEKCATTSKTTPNLTTVSEAEHLCLSVNQKSVYLISLTVWNACSSQVFLHITGTGLESRP